MRKRALCLIFCLCLLPALANAAGVGRFFDLFQESYKQNILFLNENTGRLLLPHSFARDYDSQGRRIYRIQKGALDMEMHMAADGAVIASLRITLTAPAGLTAESAPYSDFSTSNLHSYALLMSMSDAETPLERYRLLESVGAGLANGSGDYACSVGDYRLHCTSHSGVAVMLFENEALLPAAQDTPDDVPADADDDGESEGDSLAG